MRWWLRRPRLRRFRPLVAALALAAAGTAAAALVRSSAHPALAAPAAITDARASHAVRRALAGASVTGVGAVALDRRTMLVTFYSGARTQAQALVDGAGTVSGVDSFVHTTVPYGDWIVYTPAAMALLAVALVLCGAVVPLRRVRNLDLVFILALNVSIVLFRERYVRWSLLAALVPLCYLIGRGLWIGLGGGRLTGEEQRPLLECLLWRWPARLRVRVLRMVVGMLALSYLMVCASSPGAVDVAYAVMEGATRIVAGVLPYGHLPGDVFHGDTYPIFSYALYVPLAALEPVRSIWGSLEGELVFCALSALAAAALVACLANVCGGRSAGPPRIGRGLALARRSAHSAGGEEASLRAAICLLSFPAFAIVASSGSSDIVVGAIVALALVIWRRPAACSALLTAGALFKVAPGVLLGLSLAPLRGRRLVAALAGSAAVCAAALALLLALGGPGAPLAMARAISYQLSRGENQSLWTALAPSALQPLGQGAVLGLLGAIAMALRARPAIASQPRRIAALAMAVTIALQIVSNYWALLYLAWFAPLAVLSLFVERSPTEPETLAARRRADRVPARGAVGDPTARPAWAKPLLGAGR